MPARDVPALRLVSTGMARPRFADGGAASGWIARNADEVSQDVAAHQRVERDFVMWCDLVRQLRRRIRTATRRGAWPPFVVVPNPHQAAR